MLLASFLAMVWLGLGSASGQQPAPQQTTDANSTNKAGPVTITLPKPRTTGTVSVEQALAQRRSVRRLKSEPITLEELSQLLWAAQGVTTPDGRRTAPSAGATYPIELYVAAGNVTGLKPGIYKYHPQTHQLSLVKTGDVRTRLADAALGQSWVERAPATLVFGAVYDRTSRRYGQRATQYVHMEVGHAVENAHLQAVALGLGGVVIGAFTDEDVAKTVGLKPEEQPLCLLAVGRPAPE